MLERDISEVQHAYVTDEECGAVAELNNGSVESVNRFHLHCGSGVNR
jgi:hypothetical protein